MLISSPPVYDDVITDSKFSNTWQSWLNDIYNSVNSGANITNPSLLYNPDFNWSRTLGNTPTTTDGEFVDKWFVRANGMIFSITPTYYTSTKNNSNTGSERYIKLSITGLNANEFIIYQRIPKYLSLLQNKKVSFSFSVFNNSPSRVLAYGYVGFDVDNNGTDEYLSQSKSLTFEGGIKTNDFCSFQCPKIDTDNQINECTLALKLKNITNVVDLDIYFLKYELSDVGTNLYVDHALEKVRIDNS